MRWTCLSTKSFISTTILKHTHFLYLAAADYITSSTQIDFHDFHFCWYHSVRDSPVSSPAYTLHAQVVKNGTFQCLSVANYLLSCYLKSEYLDYAYKLFDEIPDRDVRSWTILISSLARNGNLRMVMELFREMQMEGVFPNQFTLSAILKCCSSASELHLAKGMHGWILINGIDLDIVLENSILDVYVKSGAFHYAEKLFEAMEKRDTVRWNIMISAYLRIGSMKKSLDLFRRMPLKDVASWNAIIDGLMRNGYERTALELLYEMVKVGPAFNKVTFSVALILASSLLHLELGRQIHGVVLRMGIHNEGFIRSSLIEMYSKCGKTQKALLIFRKEPLVYLRTLNTTFTSDESMTEIVSWSSLISGYVRNHEYEDALQTFIYMIRDHIWVDKFTVTSIASACANIGTIRLGQQIHAYTQKIGHSIDVHLASTLTDMYSKCGSLTDAWMIFEQIANPNVVLWTSMISGCALHGQGEKAVELFELMMKEGTKPNEVSFLTVLNACSHAGLLGEGEKYFKLMKEVYGFKPTVDHFTCMVDLFGRAGRLNETKEFIHKNDISHLSSVWKSFLSSCRIHKNIEMGKWVSEKLLHLEPFDEGSYVLLSNMCSTEHRWDEAAKLRSLMQQKGVNKPPGQSWIELKNQVHTFFMGDRSHPQIMEIYSYLDELIGRLKEIGYSADVKQIMQDVEEEQGEVILGYHSEKLAIAYGIISTASGTPIRIMKNLRVCTDCHNFVKYTSQLLGSYPSVDTGMAIKAVDIWMKKQWTSHAYSSSIPRLDSVFLL
ncbi:hypothetical protein FNV43_RR02889 [Rhamnella rubrinervis]|uniref:DYW domain-containing protein n=1 Tax=Rhamnella rubrinervis TaxID=2594499 RepID=A0A8K0HHC6_9ROSA|nr:hypothetical protein FNV43_RR02889 [Rhamnella rubrinervis]